MLTIINKFQKDAQKLERDSNSVEEFKMWLKADSGEQVSLDIDLISDDLYNDILNEFLRQFGEGNYYEWVLSARKTSYED